MESFLLKILVGVFLVDLVLAAWRISDKKGELQVLSFMTSVAPTLIPTELPTATPIPTPTSTPTPRPETDQPLAETSTPTPIPSPTLIPTPTLIPQPKFSQEEIHGFIERFAGQYGVDPNVLRHIATCESGFNASAVNGPYVGLFQFGSSSWINNRKLMGEDADLNLRFNAEESAQTAAFIVSRGIRNIWPNCYP